MKILGLLLIAVTASANTAAFPSFDGTSNIALVIETNSGEIGYYAQIASNTELSGFQSELLSKGFDEENCLLEATETEEARFVSLTLYFDSYQSYYDYTGIDLTAEPARKIEIKESLFFAERTITLSDPYTRFLGETNSAAQVLKDFFSYFGGGVTETDYGYVFASSFRRTQTNADRHESSAAEGLWEYYYDVSSDADAAREIVIFDRFANTPIWYGMAIAATAVFMVIFYLLARKKKSNQSVTVEPAPKT